MIFLICFLANYKIILSFWQILICLEKKYLAKKFVCQKICYEKHCYAK
jgi:hypothetical protein